MTIFKPRDPALLSALLAAPVALAAATPSDTPADLDTHWQARVAAFREIEASNLDEDGAINASRFAAADAAEIAILHSTATSPRVGVWRLLIAWSHAQPSADAAMWINEGDVATLIAMREDLDWHEKLLLAVIEQFQMMEG